MSVSTHSKPVTIAPSYPSGSANPILGAVTDTDVDSTPNGAYSSLYPIENRVIARQIA